MKRGKIFIASLSVTIFAVVIYFLLTKNCSAMIFSQPINTGGSIMFMQAGGGMKITNATYNNGDFYKNNRNSYGKGVARFGSGDDALWVHYNAYNIENDAYVHFGSKEMKNTISVSAFIFGEEIFKINTNEGITFYMIHTSYDLEEENWWTLIGRKKDGVWVKYFETANATKKYFPNQEWGICLSNMEVRGDTIAIHYRRNKQGVMLNKNNANEYGEFIFKWDSRAQWFGVDKITY